MAKEITLGIIAIALAAAYFDAAASIQVSLLSDAVGAGGVPKLLAIVLGGLGAAQIGRALLRRQADAVADGPRGLAAHLRAAGMLIIGAVYIVVTPYLGYPLAIALLLLVVIVYSGLPPSRHVVLVSSLGALVFWLTFVKLLGVAMPVGVWPALLG